MKSNFGMIIISWKMYLLAASWYLFIEVFVPSGFDLIQEVAPPKPVQFDIRAKSPSNLEKNMFGDTSIYQPKGRPEAASSSGSKRAATLDELKSNTERIERLEVKLEQILETLKHLTTRTRTPNPSPPRDTPPPLHRRTPPTSLPRSPPSSPEVNRVLNFHTDYDLRHDHRQIRKHHDERRQHRE